MWNGRVPQQSFLPTPPPLVPQEPSLFCSKHSATLLGANSQEYGQREGHHSGEKLHR